MLKLTTDQISTSHKPGAGFRSEKPGPQLCGSRSREERDDNDNRDDLFDAMVRLEAMNEKDEGERDKEHGTYIRW